MSTLTRATYTCMKAKSTLSPAKYTCMLGSPTCRPSVVFHLCARYVYPDTYIVRLSYPKSDHPLFDLCETYVYPTTCEVPLRVPQCVPSVSDLYARYVDPETCKVHLLVVQCLPCRRRCHLTMCCFVYHQIARCQILDPSHSRALTGFCAPWT